MLEIRKTNILFSLWWLLLPAFLACKPTIEVGFRQENAVPGVVKSDDRTEARCMDALFQKAIESHGKDYLDAEDQLRQGGSAAIKALLQNRNHPDPIARLMVECLLLWMQGKAPEFQAALDYLDDAPKRVEGTPLLAPPPLSIAYTLDKRFGSRVADFLALRLVNEKDWARWRIAGILLYLEEQKLPSTTSALIRFAAETENDEARGYAIKAIRAIGDPELKGKLAIERKRLEEMHKKLPEELVNLAP